MCNKTRQLIFEVRMKSGMCKEPEILSWRVNANTLRGKGEGKLALCRGWMRGKKDSFCEMSKSAKTKVEVQMKGSTRDERYVQTTKMRGLETMDRTKKQVSGIQVLDF